MLRLSELRRFGLFDAKVPRFTSYPPATRFSETVTASVVQAWQAAAPSSSDLSLYVHIPFCKRLCWFCARRTQGTKTQAPLEAYIDDVLTEARLTRASLAPSVRVRRLHLGGGTPTILPPALLDRLLSGLHDSFDLSQLDEFSVEIDPTDVGPRRLDVLARHGMTRASLGIQDFDPKVQSAIGRTQTLKQTRDVAQMLRARGITGLNFDLLYGLPYQTRRSLSHTLEETLSMEPDRLALFGYAHVPWMSKRQVMIPTEALPSPEERYGLFDAARRVLIWAGFQPIGIDHFAQPSDRLAEAYHTRSLRRSFQGYTDDTCPHLIALGASGISRYPQGYAQNLAVTGQYSRAVRDGTLPIWRGFALSQQDRDTADFVESLMCYFSAPVGADQTALRTRLDQMSAQYPDVFDWDGARVTMKDWAQPLVRVIATQAAMAADIAPEKRPEYSQAI